MLSEPYFIWKTVVLFIQFENLEEPDTDGNKIKVKAAHFSRRSPFFGVNSVKSQGRLVEYHFPSRSNSPDMSVAVGAVTGMPALGGVT